MGILADPDGGSVAPSFLEATKYLPSLANVVWDRSDDIADLAVEAQVPLDKVLQLTIRRARLSVEILKRPSDNNTKYDLFQRLNSAGTPANAQELRNCVTIMVNAQYFRFVKSLAEQPSFQAVLVFTEDQIERQKHLEYASRFLTHTYTQYDGRLDVEDFIDKGMVELATVGEVDQAGRRFALTFETLNRLYGGDALRRLENGVHVGRIGLAAFESIAIGIARNFAAIEALPDADGFIRARVEAFWAAPDVDRFFSAGLRGTTRIQRTVPFGEAWFRP
jgi:hypothetical protein